MSPGSGSLSLERGAPFYDAASTLPEDESQNVMWAMLSLSQATRATRFVDLGTGTGRFALPLRAWGQRVIGVDLSRGMLTQQRAKLPPGAPLDLIEADSTALPLAAGSADVALILHVLHLVGDWQQLLAEARRVLAPRGMILHSWSLATDEAPSRQIRLRFRELVAARGASAELPGVQSPEPIYAHLRALGATVTPVVAAEWATTTTLAAQLERYAARRHMDSWSVPDGVLESAVAELREWGLATFGAEDAPLVEPHRMTLDVVRWT